MQELKKLAILRLIDTPNFGRIPEVNTCVKKLLTCVHGGNLWLYTKVEITTQLISRITRLLIQREDLEQLFAKESEKSLAQDMYVKYDMARHVRDIIISNINDDIVKLAS